MLQLKEKNKVKPIKAADPGFRRAREAYVGLFIERLNKLVSLAGEKCDDG